MLSYKLKCYYDGHKSFYGKAIVKEFYSRITGCRQVLYSYGTKVAEIENGVLVQCDIHVWSRTTDRHIREFLKQNGLSESDLVA